MGDTFALFAGGGHALEGVSRHGQAAPICGRLTVPVSLEDLYRLVEVVAFGDSWNSPKGNQGRCQQRRPPPMTPPPILTTRPIAGARWTADTAFVHHANADHMALSILLRHLPKMKRIPPR